MSYQVVQGYDYHVWSNRQVFEHLKELPKEIYKQEIQSVFPSISKVIEHMYSVDMMWLSIMGQKPTEEVFAEVTKIREQIKSMNLEEMELRFGQLSEEYHSFFSGTHLDNVITIEHPRSGSMSTPIFELVQHVVNHGTYHRGNITAMLRQLGHPGVPTDYATFLYSIYN